MDKKIQAIRTAHAKMENADLDWGLSILRDHIGFLLQQIEIKESEATKITRMRDVFKVSFEHWNKEAHRLFSENRKLRKALEFYENKNNHQWGVEEGTMGEVIESEVMMDYGEIARAALKGEDTP